MTGLAGALEELAALWPQPWSFKERLGIGVNQASRPEPPPREKTHREGRTFNRGQDVNVKWGRDFGVHPDCPGKAAWSLLWPWGRPPPSAGLAARKQQASKTHTQLHPPPQTHTLSSKGMKGLRKERCQGSHSALVGESLRVQGLDSGYLCVLKEQPGPLGAKHSPLRKGR